MDKDQFFRAIASQQRHFDNELSDFRGFYDSMPAEEKAQFRGWLEKLDAVQKESLWEASVHVHIENDELDDKGDTVRWSNTRFTVMTMLMAIRSWDSGEN